MILASVTPDAGPILYQVLGLIPLAQPPSPLMGEMRLSPFHEAGRFIPLALQDRLVELQLALKNGDISTGVPSEKPDEK
jgi:hypothetical protein